MAVVPVPLPCIFDLLTTNYSPSLRDRFPRRDLRRAPLDPNLALFSMPLGVQITADLPAIGVVSSHTFVLTVVDGSRTHGACITTWERFLDHAALAEPTLERLMQNEGARAHFEDYCAREAGSNGGPNWASATLQVSGLPRSGRPALPSESPSPPPPPPPPFSASRLLGLPAP